MLPVQITIRDMPSSSSLEDHLRKKAMKLNQYCDRINSCRIVLHVPQKHKHQGKQYSVTIDITVPGKELVAKDKLNEDVYIAIRDAFIAIQRQLENYSRKRRGSVKKHEATNRGVIDRIFYQEDYGFLKGLDGNEYYFSVTNMGSHEFDQLQIGDLVEFIPMPAADGLHAHHVTLVKNGVG